jgi:ClpP class serine protease
VGVLPISSAITKYNVDCGAPGMIQRDGWLRDFLNNDQISAVILLMDTPGGEVRAADTFTQTIQSAQKPIITYIDGMCCSLGMWFASATDKTFFASKNGELGSIGALVRYADVSGMLEKAGIKITDIYATQSTDKNKPFRDAQAGDFTEIQEDLDHLVDDFIAHVQAGRPGAVKSADKWNTGKVFRADEAVKLGLADGVMSFNQVVSYSKFLARTKNNSK